MAYGADGIHQHSGVQRQGWGSEAEQQGNGSVDSHS